MCEHSCKYSSGDYNAELADELSEIEGDTSDSEEDAAAEAAKSKASVRRHRNLQSERFGLQAESSRGNWIFGLQSFCR